MITGKEKIEPGPFNFHKLTRCVNLNAQIIIVIIIVKEDGLTRIKIFCKSASCSNNLASDNPLGALLQKVYISLRETHRFGIIKGIPVDFTEVKFLPDINSPTKITKLQKPNFRFKENKVNFLPSRTVRLAFEGSEISKHISFGSVRMEVDPERHPSGSNI